MTQEINEKITELAELIISESKSRYVNMWTYPPYPPMLYSRAFADYLTDEFYAVAYSLLREVYARTAVEPTVHIERIRE